MEGEAGGRAGRARFMSTKGLTCMLFGTTSPEPSNTNRTFSPHGVLVTCKAEAVRFVCAGGIKRVHVLIMSVTVHMCVTRPACSAARRGAAQGRTRLGVFGWEEGHGKVPCVVEAGSTARERLEK